MSILKPLEGPALGVSEGPVESSFDSKGFLWMSLSDQWDERLVGALKARLFYEKQLYPWIEFTFSKQTSWPIGCGDFRIVKKSSI